MILLDAYALVALLGDEPVAAEVEGVMRRDRCGMSAINLAEAVDVAGRIHGHEPADVRPVVTMLTQAGSLEILPATQEVAWQAAALRRSHYSRQTRDVSLADCFLLATAGPEDEIATSDPAVAAIARDEKIRLVVLPDSAGRRP